MSCRICFNAYDHCIHKPYTLSYILHTFCMSCIKIFKKYKCPVCQEIIYKKALCIDLLESNYNKLKAESFKVLNNFIETGNDLKNKRDDQYLKKLVKSETLLIMRQIS